MGDRWWVLSRREKLILIPVGLFFVWGGFTLATAPKSSPIAAPVATVPGPSDEDVRRVRFERQQREKQARQLMVSLCESQPYLNRCR